ncbi:divalent metal cation transporter [Alicyclobacillus mengziensis]|uniref:Divalent metal cation transporter n=2 Tax=Alicyclobacillus mengziensis TaxID=2931921 RepID=A0A9X7VWX6_9BACL|nr:divalent metal cation transporter [Alicyclobacillus mengziensis]
MMDIQEKIDAPTQERKPRFQLMTLFWIVLGPGLLAMIGDNDAGGVLSYVITGIQFGIGFFIPFILLLAPLTYTVQEMVMRLCVVTQRSFTTLISERFGTFWVKFSLGTLLVNNILSLITEFIGMSAGLSMLGIPFVASDLLSLVIVIVLAIFGSYWTKERLALLLGTLNVVFLVVSFMTHPSLAKIGNAFTYWSIPAQTHTIFLWYIIATIGNAFAPWMIFFQGGAVLDKGMTVKDLRFGRLDTVTGSVSQVVIAAILIICGAALYTPSGNVMASLSGPLQVIHAYAKHIGIAGEDLFAFGLFNAGFLAAFTISMSTSWTFATTLGWANSLNDKVHKAPKFYGIYIGSVILAALIVLIPSLPLNVMAVIAQFVSAILIIPALFFLLFLARDRRLMGKYANGTLYNAWGWFILVGIAVLSVLLLYNFVRG